MGLREWVILLAVIIMLVLAADAWRRIRRQRRYHGGYVTPTPGTDKHEDLKVSRVAGRRAPVTAPRMVRPSSVGIAPSSDAEPDTVDGFTPDDVAPDEDISVTELSAAIPEPDPIPEPAPIRHTGRLPPQNLREKVPMLLDSVEEDETELEPDHGTENQFEFDLTPPSEPPEPRDFASAERSSELLEEDDSETGDVLLSTRPTRAPGFATEFTDAAKTRKEERVADHPPADWTTEASDHGPLEREETSPFAHLDPPFNTQPEPEVTPEASRRGGEMAAPTSEQRSTEFPDGDAREEEAGDQLLSEPEQVLVMTVLARKGEEFDGATLLQIMLACGMRFGNMNIFHATDEHGRLQYSAANAYNPGTFDLDSIEHFSTRGVTFFQQLPCQCKAMEAFEAMYHTASTLASHMNGEILDETRSVMTTQTLTHYQERIRDYQRAQLVRRA